MKKEMKTCASYAYWKLADKDREFIINARKSENPNINIARIHNSYSYDQKEFFYDDVTEPDIDSFVSDDYKRYKELLRDFDICQPKVRNKMIVGLNFGGSKNSPTCPPLHNFHNSKNDMYLAIGVIKTGFEGAFLTDIIKETPTVEGNEAKKIWENMSAKEKKKHQELFLKEIRDIVWENSGTWEYLTIVALGIVANKILKEVLEMPDTVEALNKYKLVPVLCKLIHYSTRLKNGFSERDKNYIMLNQFAELEAFLTKRKLLGVASEENAKKLNLVAIKGLNAVEFEIH